jgi:two-component system sensor histidine kinase YesM
MIFIIPFSGFLIFYNLYMAEIMKRQEAFTNLERLEFRIKAFEDELRSIESYMANIAANDLYFGRLRYKLSALDAHVYSFNVLEKHKGMISSRETIDCLAIYTGKNELFRRAFGSGLDYETRTALTNRLAELLQGPELSNKWFCEIVEGRAFLILFRGIGDLQNICVVDLSRLSGSVMYGDEKDEIFCVSEGSALTNKTFVEEAMIQVGMDPSYYITGRPQKYLVVRTTSTYLSLDCRYASAFSGIGERGDFLFPALLGASFILVFLLLLCFLIMRKRFFEPLSSISEALKQIGEEETEISLPQSSILELKQFSQALTGMTEQVRRWRIIAYEKTLAAKEAQLQHLQLQIRPHFYLNVLKSLYNLAQRNESEKMQNMLLLFSSYLRAIFMQAGALNPMSREIANTQSYIALVQLTSSMPIMLKSSIIEELDDYQIPAMAIITFVENAVKHAASFNKPLSISIRASILEGEGQRHANIAIHDNGPGFSEKMLEALNSGAVTALEKDGHIGISNALKRIDIHYGGKAVVTFMNSSGASVELFLPI